jgi:hypothetical protein
MGMTIRKALRIAKTVKLSLASGADGSFVSMTPEDRERAYKKAIAKQGRTINERRQNETLEEHTLKAIGLV